MNRKKRENSSVTTRNGFPSVAKSVPVPKGEEKTSPKDGNVHKNSRGHVLSDSNMVGMKNYFCRASFVGVFKVLVLIIIMPPLLNYASLQRELTSLSRPGEMHDGPRGNKLLMNCSGKGSPVIVMDTPGGFSSDLWTVIASEVARFTKVCIYDRAGLGFSERAVPRFYDDQQTTSSVEPEYEQFRPTSKNMVADIHHLVKTVLHSSDVVLVGGGLGAINARFYARFYESVFGIILINSFHENMFDDQEWSTFWYDHFIPSLFIERIFATMGLVRLGILTGLHKPSILYGHFENDVAIRLKHLLCNSGHLSTGIMEHYYMNESLAQLRILQKLKSFPRRIHVNLISSRNFSNYLPASLNELWFTKQELFAKEMLIDSERTIVDSDFNSVYFNQPDIIVKAIKKIVMKFRISVKQSAKI